jgi:hypothetical protein
MDPLWHGLGMLLLLISVEEPTHAEETAPEESEESDESREGFGRRENQVRREDPSLQARGP